MTRAKAEKIKRGIEDKIRKSTVDMEWWADFWGFTVDEYEEFLDMAIEALKKQSPCDMCEHENEDCWEMCQFCPAEPKGE